MTTTIPWGTPADLTVGGPPVDRPAAPPTDVGVFGPDDAAGLAAFFRAHGFAVLRGLWPAKTLHAVDAACTGAQEALLRGDLAPHHGTAALVDDGLAAATPVAHYVTRLTELLPDVRRLVLDPVPVGLVRGWLGECWLLEGEPFGVVLQDARPGRESAYTRIGWHSDWQSSPHLPERWPAVSFTYHLDATSPANGFLRVVPGSHLWATPAPVRDAAGAPVLRGADAVGGHTSTPPPFAMPTGFEKVPGEVAVYCEAGDLLFHDAYLWHSAARATDDATRRRHVRGSWFSGRPSEATVADFVKNAAR